MCIPKLKLEAVEKSGSTGFPELELAETNLGYRLIMFAVTRLPQISN